MWVPASRTFPTALETPAHLTSSRASSFSRVAYARTDVDPCPFACLPLFMIYPLPPPAVLLFVGFLLRLLIERVHLLPVKGVGFVHQFTRWTNDGVAARRISTVLRLFHPAGRCCTPKAQSSGDTYNRRSQGPCAIGTSHGVPPGHSWCELPGLTHDRTNIVYRQMCQKANCFAKTRKGDGGPNAECGMNGRRTHTEARRRSERREEYRISNTER